MFSGHRLDGSSGMKRADGTEMAGRFFQQSSWATYALALEHQLVKVPESLDFDTTGPYEVQYLDRCRHDPGMSFAGSQVAVSKYLVRATLGSQR